MEESTWKTYAVRLKPVRGLWTPEISVRAPSRGIAIEFTCIVTGLHNYKDGHCREIYTAPDFPCAVLRLFMPNIGSCDESVCQCDLLYDMEYNPCDGRMIQAYEDKHSRIIYK